MNKTMSSQVSDHSNSRSNGHTNGNTNGHSNGVSSLNGNSRLTNNMGSSAIRKDMRPRYNESTFLQLFFATQLTGTLMLAAVLIWTVNYCGGFGWTDYNERFNWHPILMILGLVYFAGNSLLAFRVFKKQPKPLVKIIHASLHILAFFTATFGSLAVFTGHFAENKPNLYSLHSWIGFSTMVLFFVQYVAGFYAYLFPTASGNVRSALLPYHILAGFALLILSLMASLTGFAEKMGFARSNPYNQYGGAMWSMNMSGIFMIIFAFLVLYLGTERSYMRHAIPEQIPLTRTGRDDSPLSSPN